MLAYSLLVAAVLPTSPPKVDWSTHSCLSCYALQEPVVQSPTVPDARHQADINRDAEMGKKYSAEVDKQSKPSEDKEMIERVNRIGAEFAKIANENAVVVTWGDKRLSPFNYKFTVIKDETVNAFSLPGGYIYVHEGLVKFAESDDELAGVMAHEVAHASLRHVATLQREANKLSLITLPAVLVAILGGGGAAGDLANLGVLVGTAVQSGWSVDAEKAADYAGFQYMLKSKYNPVGMLTFMERLGKKDPVREAIDWGIYRTHPPSRERSDAIKGNLSRYGVSLRRSLVSPSYRVLLTPTKDAGIEMSYQKKVIYTFRGSDAQKRAENSAVAVNQFFDLEPALFDLDVSGSSVMGRRRPLIEVSLQEAMDAKTNPEQLARQTKERLRQSLFTLNMKLWSFN
jgi:beta-barrel assembly-enhancing protease